MSVAYGSYRPDRVNDSGISVPRHPLLNAGTLVLVEAGDPFGELGVRPTLQNIAAPVVNARASGAGADWVWVEEVTSGRWKRERTSGGAVHAAAGAVAGSARARYKAPAALNTLLKSLRTQNLVFWMIGRPTGLPATTFTGRQALFEWFNYTAIPGAGAGGMQVYAQFDQAPNPANTMWIRLYTNAGSGGSVSAFGNTTGGVAWASGALRVPVGATFCVVVNLKDMGSADLEAMAGMSTASGAGYGFEHIAWGIEDIAASGRGWTSVLNDVEAFRQAQCVSPGGQYTGESWTPPSTLASM